MRFVFSNHLQTANESLRANRLRTLLTITGVTIGIASIVAVLSLADGATKIISRQVDESGGNLLVVRSAAGSVNSLEEAVNNMTNQATTTSTLSANDVEQLAKLPNIEKIAPLFTLTTNTKSDTDQANATIVGTTPDLFSISDLQFNDGEFQPTNPDLVSIGAQLSVKLFGTEESLGKSLTIKGQPFRVSGVIKRQNRPITFDGVDFDNSVIVNLPGLRQLDDTAHLQQINLRVNTVANLDQAVIQINKTLLSLHHDEHDFHVASGDEIAAPTGQLFLIIAGVVTVIAGIALFVGGVGIMNIMLVNVSERTHEIGVRKALGATNSDIAWQFLIEAIIMSIVGGIVGTLLGLLGAFILSLFLTFNPMVTWQIGAIALAISLLIGSIFGLYPALRAARKDPISALTLTD